MPKVSIIIRSKNEEKWIAACLEAIQSQSFTDYEIILVDNESTDRTVEKAKQFDIQIIEYQDEMFHPGRAINIGIRASSGNYITNISAHCIPVNEYWLENLVRNFVDPQLAGVYGRQEPLPFTSDLDKRDLINIFGLDKKIQRKDPFFHNANSMIRRDVWEKVPFDEDTLHIEDRIWATEVLKRGYMTAYEPEASVFHFHGINQGRNIPRAERIVRILEQIHCPNNVGIIEGLNITTIIPSRGKPRLLNGEPLIERTIRAAFGSRYVNKVVVASDNEETLSIAEKQQVQTILRPRSLSSDYVGLVQVYQYVLKQLQEKQYWPDLVVLLEEIYPFRPPWLVDRMIEGLLHGEYDTVIAACPEYGSIWRKDGNDLVRVDHGLMPSTVKEPLFRGLIGLGCVTHPNVISEGSKIGKKVGLIKTDDQFSNIALYHNLDFTITELLDKKWREITQSESK